MQKNIEKRKVGRLNYSLLGFMKIGIGIRNYSQIRKKLVTGEKGEPVL